MSKGQWTAVAIGSFVGVMASIWIGYYSAAQLSPGHENGLALSVSYVTAFFGSMIVGTGSFFLMMQAVGRLVE